MQVLLFRNILLINVHYQPFTNHLPTNYQTGPAIMPPPSYQEKDYVLIHHDRSNYCHDGNCMLVGHGQMFPVKEISDNTIAVEDCGGFQFQLQLSDPPQCAAVQHFHLAEMECDQKLSKTQRKLHRLHSGILPKLGHIQARNYPYG